jgi:hypothetical protein
MDPVLSKTIEGAKMTDCSICFESITKTTGCCVLSCSHSFHIKCLSKWTSDASTCPLCRHALSDIELNRPDPSPKPEITRSEERWINIGNYTWTTESRIRQVQNQASVTRSCAIRELRDSGGNVDEAILMARDTHRIRYIPSTPPQPRNPMEPTDDMLTAWALERLFKYGTIEEGYDYGSLADTIQRTNVTRFSGHASSLWMNTDFVGSEVRERSLSV